MSIEPYVINDVEIQDINQSIAYFQSLFNELTLSHIPIKEQGNFIGCIAENDIRCFEANKKLTDYQYAIEYFGTHPEEHWLDCYTAFAKNNANIMPVVTKDTQTYLGYIELHDMLDMFYNTSFLHEPGAIIIIEKGIKDYSFSEICQIVESGQNKVLGAIVNKLSNDTAQITIKLSPEGINEVLQNFRRYNYKIISSHQEDAFLENLKDRSKYLDKYLNI